MKLTQQLNKIQSKLKIPLNRSNDDVIDRNEDKLNKEPYESHNNETNRCTHSYLREFCNQSKSVKIKPRSVINLIYN